jgi:hypothetical protein
VQRRNTLLYVDTDSIIYKYKESDGDPLAHHIGDTVGSLSDEYPNHDIQEFVCSGNKSYAIKLLNKKNGETEFVMKSKGLTLDYTTCKRLNYERFRQMVVQYYSKDGEAPNCMNLQYGKIRSSKTGDVQTVETSRCFRPLITKGLTLTDSSIVPFGYYDPKDEYCLRSYMDFIKNNPNYEWQAGEPFYEPLVKELGAKDNERRRKNELMLQEERQRILDLENIFGPAE